MFLQHYNVEKARQISEQRSVPPFIIRVKEKEIVSFDRSPAF